MTEIIVSPNSKTLRLVNSLQTTKGRRKHGSIVLEGYKMVNDAISNGAEITHLLLSESYFNSVRIQKLINNHKSFRIFEVSDKLFLNISDTVHSQGIIAIAKRPTASLNTRSNKILVLNNVQDPGNLGTLIRTADAFGFDKIIVTKGSCDVYNPKTLRSTMSSIFNLPIVDGVTSGQAIEYLKNNNIKIITSILSENSKELTSTRVTKDYAVVLGNEGNGVEDIWKQNANIAVKIPMYGKAESLNVAIAGGVLMYHFSCLR